MVNIRFRLLVFVLGHTGWVVLSCDSGGGLYGLHLSMEVALICWQNEIDLVPLPSYMTRALMTLDRAPHRQMEATWSHERHSYSARHGDVARTSFQFLPLLRTSWEAGVRESVTSASFDECGLHTWAPEKLLCGEQAAELFSGGEPHRRGRHPGHRRLCEQVSLLDGSRFSGSA